MAYDDNNKMLYVVESEVNQVQIVDTTKDAVVGTIPVGITPTIIQIDSTTNTAYVTNWESNNISMIDLASNKVVGSISTGFVPAHMAIDPVKHKLYVTHHVSSYVSVINLSTRTLESNIQLKGPSHALAVDPKTGLLIVTYLPASPVTGSGYMNRVEIIDTNTDKVVNGFDIPANPFEIKISGDQKLFASVVNTGTVYAVDLTTNPQYQQIVSQAIPEFGQIAPIILVIAIMAIVVSARTRIIPQF
jgi:YVTN family beta-propeller protein